LLDLHDAPIIADLYRLAVDRCISGGLYLEFGVASGRSLRRLRSLIPKESRLYGFDSFQGLPEPWNGFRTGSFKTSIRPCLTNTELVVGWYQDTVPPFVQKHQEYVSLMHVDCDLYSSTQTVLWAFKDQIVPGTVAVFDELFGYEGFEQHEYKALDEFIRETGKQFKVIGRWNAYRAAIQFEG
jgi:hypothetical protein